MIKIVSLGLNTGASLTDALNALTALNLSPCYGANWNTEIQGIISQGVDMSTLKAYVDDQNTVTMWQYSTVPSG